LQSGQRNSGKLGAALVRGVDVYIVVSNPTCRAGGLSPLQAQYANGWTVAQVAQKIRDYMIANPVANQPSGDALRALSCQKLHVTSIRSSPSGTWPGGVTAANHAKLVFVDDQAFYIGSQNEYVADLTEFGYLVDDKRAAAQARRRLLGAAVAVLAGRRRQRQRSRAVCLVTSRSGQPTNDGISSPRTRSSSSSRLRTTAYCAPLTITSATRGRVL
jgi:hypothetical protein